MRIVNTPMPLPSKKKVNRKPKDLIFDDGQKAIISNNEILLFIDYRRISNKNASRLGRWLLKASEYLKNRKEKRDNSGYLP